MTGKQKHVLPPTENTETEVAISKNSVNTHKGIGMLLAKHFCITILITFLVSVLNNVLSYALTQ